MFRKNTESIKFSEHFIKMTNPISYTAELEDVSKGDVSLTLSRALNILASFDSENPEKGISELSRELWMSKTSVQRIVNTLEKHKFLDHNPSTRKYRVGVQAYRVGSRYPNGKRLEEVALPLMQELVQSTGLTCYLSELQDEHMVILSSLESIGRIRYSIPIGEKLPLHCTATGKAALSIQSSIALNARLSKLSLEVKTPFTKTKKDDLIKQLLDVQKRGYSINWEENTVGVASVAACILGSPKKEEVQVISLGFATSQVSQTNIDSLGELVKKSAHLIGQIYWGVTELKMQPNPQGKL